MKRLSKPNQNRRTVGERRKSTRYGSALDINVRLSPDGTPLNGAATEIGPNGMRILTKIPLVEASYVLISFQSASNNTHCEGRVVWSQPVEGDGEFESGVDIQKWGGGIPGQDVVQKIPRLKTKKDRRKKAS